MPSNLQPFKKKEEPAYVGHERNFAKQRQLRQTPSSGRFGIIKGDSFDTDFAYDNKGTKSWCYNLDSRKWRDFRKRSLLVARIPAIQVSFSRTGESVIIVPEDAWFKILEEARGRRDIPTRTGTNKSATAQPRGRTRADRK
jgi:hypothetical protein